jgi:hypothetical protein
MRFESLLWSILAMFLVVNSTWETPSLADGATADGATATDTFQSADSGSDIPPPTRP